MATELITEIEIAASPAIVWNILMDFARYGEWNPFIQNIQGEAKVGARLENKLLPPGGKAMIFKPEVKVVNPEREFRWLGRLWMAGIFDGEHRFELHRLPNGNTRFVQAEVFRGILVPFLKGMLNGQTREGFVQMNAALKRRAENADSKEI